MGNTFEQESKQQQPVNNQVAPGTPVEHVVARGIYNKNLNIGDSPTPMSPATTKRIAVDPRSPDRTRTPVEQNVRKPLDPRSPNVPRSPMDPSSKNDDTKKQAPRKKLFVDSPAGRKPIKVTTANQEN